jgi:hypothetical protein
MALVRPEEPTGRTRTADIPETGGRCARDFDATPAQCHHLERVSSTWNAEPRLAASREEPRGL